MPKHAHRWIAALLVLIALLAGGCGSGPDPDSQVPADITITAHRTGKASISPATLILDGPRPLKIKGAYEGLIAGIKVNSYWFAWIDKEGKPSQTATNGCIITISGKDPDFTTCKLPAGSYRLGNIKGSEELGAVEYTADTFTITYRAPT